MTDHGYDVLDVHHHVGDAFSALGGDLDPSSGMSAAEYERVELEVGRRVSHLLAQIVKSELDDREKALILGGNARSLFGLGDRG